MPWSSRVLMLPSPVPTTGPPCEGQTGCWPLGSRGCRPDALNLAGVLSLLGWSGVSPRSSPQGLSASTHVSCGLRTRGGEGTSVPLRALEGPQLTRLTSLELPCIDAANPGSDDRTTLRGRDGPLAARVARMPPRRAQPRWCPEPSRVVRRQPSVVSTGLVILNTSEIRCSTTLSLSHRLGTRCGRAPCGARDARGRKWRRKGQKSAQVTDLRFHRHSP